MWWRSGSTLVTALLLGEQRACQRHRGPSITAAAAMGLELAGSPGQEHPPHNPHPSLKGVINHLVSTSSSAERSHLGRSRRLLEDIHVLMILPVFPPVSPSILMHMHTNGPDMQKASSSAAVCLSCCLLRSPPQ